MPKEVSYFANHEVAVKFPFTLYHSPIENQIDRELSRLARPDLQALNLGCGLFATYPLVKDRAAWSACDLDARAVEAVRAHYPSVNAFVCGEMPLLEAARYDLIIAKEVIEHVLQPVDWVRALYAGLKPGGVILLSTPNYGISLLPILEYTVLEVIARLKGFSRFGIHPTKFHKQRLLRTLHESCPGAEISVQKISFGMVLFAKLQKPPAPRTPAR